MFLGWPRPGVCKCHGYPDSGCLSSFDPIGEDLFGDFFIGLHPYSLHVFLWGGRPIRNAQRQRSSMREASLYAATTVTFVRKCLNLSQKDSRTLPPLPSATTIAHLFACSVEPRYSLCFLRAALPSIAMCRTFFISSVGGNIPTPIHGTQQFSLRHIVERKADFSS